MANLVQPAHCLSVPHTLPSIGSVSLSLLLSSTVCPLSVSTSQCTVFWFCVTVSTDAFHSLFNVSQYLTMYRLFRSVSLCPLLSSRVCPLSVSRSQFTVCWFCVTMSTAAFYSLSTVCQYLTLYRPLVLCHCAHCRLLQSVHCLSVPHNVPSVSFCVTMSIATYYSLSTVCQYLKIYRLLVLCHYVHCCLLQSIQCLSVLHTRQSFHCLAVSHKVPTLGSVSLCPLRLLDFVHCLSVPHTIPSVGSLSLIPLLFSTVSPLSISISNCTVC